MKMSQTSRQRLITDAEKLFAAEELWLQYGKGAKSVHLRFSLWKIFTISFSSEGAPDDVLLDSILTLVEDSSDQLHEDALRAFFKLQVRNQSHTYHKG